MDLYQFFENEKITYYQLKFANQERLIFVVYKNTLLPVLFDLNHVIYENKDKNFDHQNNKTTKWNLENEKEQIIEQLMDI